MNHLETALKGLGVALNNKGYTIATAEQCTCGLIGASIASDSATKSFLKGSATAYSEDAIKKCFEVPEHTIERNGLISTHVAMHMALTTLYKFSVNISISVVGLIDKEHTDVQVCVAKMTGKEVKFDYSAIKENVVSSKSDNIEYVISKAIMSSIKHIMED